MKARHLSVALLTFVGGCANVDEPGPAPLESETSAPRKGVNVAESDGKTDAALTPTSPPSPMGDRSPPQAPSETPPRPAPPPTQPGPGQPSIRKLSEQKTIECTTSTGQTCAERWVTNVVSVTDSFSFVFAAGDGICSSFYVRVFVDGQERGMTTVMSASAPKTDRLSFGVRPGKSSRLELQAEGLEGGCNQGRMYSWGGTLHVETFE